MLQFLVTGLAFVMFSAGALHLAVGVRRRGDRIHLAFGLTALLYGAFAAFTVPLVASQTVEELATWRMLKHGAGYLAWLTFLWFALELTEERRRWWILIPFLLPPSFLFPDQFGRVTELRPLELPWGEVVTGYDRSVGPLAYIHLTLSIAVLIYLGICAFKLGRKRRSRGLFFGIALLFFAFSLFDDLIPAISSFGDELGFALFVVLMNVYLIDDAVEVVEAREDAQLSRARLQALVDSSPEAILLVDAERRVIIAANAPSLQFFGSDVVGRRCSAILDASAPMQQKGLNAQDKMNQLLERAQHGEQRVASWTLKDGDESIPCELRVMPLHPDDRLLRISFIDLRAQAQAERRRELAEEQLRRAERLNALGQMTSRIAHDLNNLLLPIMARADLAAERAHDDPEMTRDLAHVISAAERASSLARRILDFSAGRSRAPACDAREVVEAVLPLLETAAPAKVTVETELAEQCPIALPADRLEQVLTNLVVNAFHASPAGGRVRVEVVTVEASESLREQHPTLEARRVVLLRVIDEGAGIPPDIREKIFEPFYSTKGPDVGTGLGLAIVHDIVKDAHGSLYVDSTPGEGSTFEVALPVEAAPRQDACSMHSTASSLS